MSRNVAGIDYHPETKIAIEKVHYAVTHNIPIKREMLYEVAPDYFHTEIE